MVGNDAAKERTMPLAISIQNAVREAVYAAPFENDDVRGVPGYPDVLISHKPEHNCCPLIGSVEMGGGITINVFQVQH
jgi:hypothetical protein